MTYAAGIDLQADMIRMAFAVAPGDKFAGVDPDVIEIPPSLLVENDEVLIGTPAEDRAREVGQGLVTDIVSQFSVDRLWFSGGRMFTPDVALQELLRGAMRIADGRNGGLPSSVTISCPDQWSGESLDRLAPLVTTWPAVAITGGLDARSAADDAALRLPAPIETDYAGDPGLPPTEPSVRRRRSKEPTATTPRPRRHDGPGRPRAILITGGVIAVLLIALFGAAIVGANDPNNGMMTAATAPPGTLRPQAPLDVPPLVVGTLSSATAIPEVESAARAINAAGGVFGRPMALQQRAIGADPAAATRSLLATGVAGLVASGSPSELDAIASVSGGAGVPVCVLGASPSSAIQATVFFGGPSSCTTLFALGATRAGSPAPVQVAAAGRDIADEQGTSCAGYVQCANFITDGQDVQFQPTDQPVSLFTTA